MAWGLEAEQTAHALDRADAPGVDDPIDAGGVGDDDDGAIHHGAVAKIDGVARVGEAGPAIVRGQPGDGLFTGPGLGSQVDRLAMLDYGGAGVAEPRDPDALRAIFLVTSGTGARMRHTVGAFADGARLTAGRTDLLAADGTAQAVLLADDVAAILHPPAVARTDKVTADAATGHTERTAGAAA